MRINSIYFYMYWLQYSPSELQQCKSMEPWWVLQVIIALHSTRVCCNPLRYSRQFLHVSASSFSSDWRIPGRYSHKDDHSTLACGWSCESVNDRRCGCRSPNTSDFFTELSDVLTCGCEWVRERHTRIDGNPHSDGGIIEQSQPR